MFMRFGTAVSMKVTSNNNNNNIAEANKHYSIRSDLIHRITVTCSAESVKWVNVSFRMIAASYFANESKCSLSQRLNKLLWIQFCFCKYDTFFTALNGSIIQCLMKWNIWNLKKNMELTTNDFIFSIISHIVCSFTKR